MISVLIGGSDVEHACRGNNLPLPQRYVGVVEPGEQLCQRDETVPPGRPGLEFIAGVYGRPGPPLEVTPAAGRRGTRGAGYRDGWTRVPLEGFRRAARTARRPAVCVRNAGDSHLAFAGRHVPPTAPRTVAGGPPRAASRCAGAGRAVDLVGAGAEVAQRVTFGKADLGTWTPALVLLVWSGRSR